MVAASRRLKPPGKEPAGAEARRCRTPYDLTAARRFDGSRVGRRRRLFGTIRKVAAEEYVFSNLQSARPVGARTLILGRAFGMS
jgi:hypothetical protein